jgi:hypothetical protein
MKKLPIVFLLCILIAWPLASFAQMPAATNHSPVYIPPIILSGLHELANGKPDEAEKAWLKGSQWEGQQVPEANDLRAFMQENGTLQSFDLISGRELSPRINVLYLALNFDKRPRIAKFVLYRTGDGWILLHQELNLDMSLLESLAPASQ